MASEAAKSEMLTRIRTANAGETGVADAARAWGLIPRTYRRGTALPKDALLDLLIDRLRDYDAEVECSAEADVSSAVVAALQARGNPRMLMASGFSFNVSSQQNTFAIDDNFTPVELDAFGGILTEATLAIAETGTLVLQNVPGQGRRAPTLVPDFHLCVLRASQVVESVPEAMDRLAATAMLPTTFISGPSATADIEMTRIKGVHGPRFLHVLIVD